jgi:hypothetical protein
VTLKELNLIVRKKFEDHTEYNLWQTTDIFSSELWSNTTDELFTKHVGLFPKFLSQIAFNIVVTFIGFHPLRILNGG